MAQTFIINKESTLPYLRMRLINDGRYDLNHINLALQSADVTFTMINKETGIKKISNAKAYIVSKMNGCQEEYSIEYRWKKRDTQESGVFIGLFTIKFNIDKLNDNIIIPTGNLIVPIKEELNIIVNNSSIHK